VLLIQDADSILRRRFIDGGLVALDGDPRLGAVGGTFRGKPPQPDASMRERFLTHLQDNEYARYARDVRRLKGRCLVVTGTASMFRGRHAPGGLGGTSVRAPASTRRSRWGVRHVRAHGGQRALVRHDDSRLTLLAPRGMTLTIEAMPTLRQLSRQRLRCTRGAVENCFQYGFNRVTAGYWGRQGLSAAGIGVTAVYLGTVIYAVATHDFYLQPFWAGVTLIFALERFVTLKDKGCKAQLTAALMYELPYDLFLLATQARAYANAILGKEKKLVATASEPSCERPQ
jgi:poly-beta-1,6-N-acetyl-D-glucosamine synthase